MTQKTLTSKCKLCNGTGWMPTKTGYKSCKCIEEAKIKKLWDNFGIDINDIKRINEYKSYNDETEKAKKNAVEYVKNFETINNTRENGFALYGQPGGGKTHIVVGIGRALLEKNIQVIYMPYLEAIRELKCNVMDEEHYLKLLKRYQRTKVLIIDDLFKDKVKKGKLTGQLTETDMKHIYPIINFRYINKLPMLISTECTPNMLMDLDDALGGRILECVAKYSIVFGSDSNYRLKKFINESDIKC